MKIRICLTCVGGRAAKKYKKSKKGNWYRRRVMSTSAQTRCEPSKTESD